MSLIHEAAQIADPAVAVRKLAAALELTEPLVSPRWTPWDDGVWRMSDVPQRCLMIGEWLRSVAYDAADLKPDEGCRSRPVDRRAFAPRYRDNRGIV